jgi:hypothetical protein
MYTFVLLHDFKLSSSSQLPVSQHTSPTFVRFRGFGIVYPHHALCMNGSLQLATSEGTQLTWNGRFLLYVCLRKLWIKKNLSKKRRQNVSPLHYASRQTKVRVLRTNLTGLLFTNIVSMYVQGLLAAVTSVLFQVTQNM